MSQWLSRRPCTLERSCCCCHCWTQLLCHSPAAMPRTPPSFLRNAVILPTSSAGRCVVGAYCADTEDDGRLPAYVQAIVCVCGVGWCVCVQHAAFAGPQGFECTHGSVLNLTSPFSLSLSLSPLFSLLFSPPNTAKNDQPTRFPLQGVGM